MRRCPVRVPYHPPREFILLWPMTAAGNSSKGRRRSEVRRRKRASDGGMENRRRLKKVTKWTFHRRTSTPPFRHQGDVSVDRCVKVFQPVPPPPQTLIFSFSFDSIRNQQEDSHFGHNRAVPTAGRSESQAAGANVFQRQQGPQADSVHHPHMQEQDFPNPQTQSPLTLGPHTFQERRDPYTTVQSGAHVRRYVEVEKNTTATIHF